MYDTREYYYEAYMNALEMIGDLKKKLKESTVSEQRLWNLVDYLMDPSHSEEEKVDMKFNYEMWLERKEN